MKDSNKPMTREQYEKILNKKTAEINVLFNAVSSIAVSLYSTEFGKEFIFSHKADLVEELLTIKTRKTELLEEILYWSMQIFNDHDTEE